MKEKQKFNLKDQTKLLLIKAFQWIASSLFTIDIFTINIINICRGGSWKGSRPSYWPQTACWRWTWQVKIMVLVDLAGEVYGELGWSASLCYDKYSTIMMDLNYLFFSRYTEYSQVIIYVLYSCTTMVPSKENLALKTVFRLW